MLLSLLIFIYFLIFLRHSAYSTESDLAQQSIFGDNLFIVIHITLLPAVCPHKQDSCYIRTGRMLILEFFVQTMAMHIPEHGNTHQNKSDKNSERNQEAIVWRYGRLLFSNKMLMFVCR